MNPLSLQSPAAPVSPHGWPPDPITTGEQPLAPPLEGDKEGVLPQKDPNGMEMHVDSIAPAGSPSGNLNETAPNESAKSSSPAPFLASYAGVVAGGSSSPGAPINQWIPVGERDLIPGTFNGEPELTISDGFRARLSAPWQRTLVVRLLGRSIGYAFLCNRLRALWRPTGSMDVHALDQDFFLVKLGNDQDYYKALTDGPWTIFDHYLIVQQWSPSFRVYDKLPSTMVVWIQLPGFPVHFYHKDILFSIGNMIGRSIKLDYHTQNQQRTKFARVAVEVDLTKPLVPRVRLDGKWQKVEFENLPTVCFECGMVGHTKVTCPKIRQQLVVATQGDGNPPVVDAGDSETPEVNGGFGPWMLVTRKSRRNQRELPTRDTPALTNDAVHGNHKLQMGNVAATKDIAEGNFPHQETSKSRHPPKNQIQSKSLGNKEGDSVRREKEGNGSKKGKEKVHNNFSVGGNGILGPSPSGLKSPSMKSTAGKDKEEASSSRGQGDGLDGRLLGLQNLKLNVEGPMAVPAQVLNGQNGTKMQIVEASIYPSSSARKENPDAPSASARTKQRKKISNEERRGNRASPSKAMSGRKISSKALQIWTPKKEKKSKPRERRVSVTLQQIEEWTAAAGIREGINGGQSSSVLQGDDGRETRASSETPPPA
ncbi:unnamed protein product [Linum trigynum]|uniref:CCHC-type domain-containing protein n=1 Tax=Linum trigynum TaxID=586398 RepID=A0AAV2EAD7_9ROSI